MELYQMIQENFFILSQKEILDDQITSLYEISQAESAVEEKKRDEKLNNFYSSWRFRGFYQCDLVSV